MMTPFEQRPFLAWPGWTHLKVTLQQALSVSALFAFVFISTNWITAHRLGRVRVDFDAERHIPLFSPFTIVYMSIYALFIAAPFVLRTRSEIRTLAVSQMFTIVIAGICFLLIPAPVFYTHLRA